MKFSNLLAQEEWVFSIRPVTSGSTESGAQVSSAGLPERPEPPRKFVQEAVAASALDHPNICTIYEIGDTEDGQLFIAMAYYEGERPAVHNAWPAAD